jgi:hypothetical protein
MSDKVTDTAYVLVWNLNSNRIPFPVLYEPGHYVAPKKGEPENFAVIAIEPTPGKVMPPLRELAKAHPAPVVPALAL